MTPTEAQRADFNRRLMLAYRAPSPEIVAAQGISELDFKATAEELAEMEAGASAMRERIIAWGVVLHDGTAASDEKSSLNRRSCIDS